MNKKNIGIYIRTCSKDKKQLKKEKEIIRKYLKINNYDLNKVKYFIDYGVSGIKRQKPKLNKLIEDYNNKKINVIITKDISRLGRGISIINELENKGLDLEKIKFIEHQEINNEKIDNLRKEINKQHKKDISR